MPKSERELCLALMKADTEQEVIDILKKAGYWDREACWRPYGDKTRATTASSAINRVAPMQHS